MHSMDGKDTPARQSLRLLTVTARARSSVAWKPSKYKSRKSVGAGWTSFKGSKKSLPPTERRQRRSFAPRR